MNHSGSDELLIARLFDLPAAERAAYWQRACTDHPGLADRSPEITRIFGPIVSTPANPPPSFDAVARVLESALSPVDHEAPGTTIGHYKLLQKIGEGGFGTVWMAEQQEPIRRRVALKIIKAGLDTAEVIARFEAERQALALMEHPNIARVFDAGATPTGRPYFVMELVRGVAITHYCDENRLTAEARLNLFVAVCQAVQHAHQKGVIHRDLKPSNILVTLHDGAPVPKIIDFGIAKATDKPLTNKTLVTQFHVFVGTPSYTSPEQMEMSGLDVDTRSDIYSLGVLLYELLAGRPPFDPDALVKSGLDAMRRTIREVDPPRPSARLRTLSDEDRTTVAGRRGTDSAKLAVLLRGDLDWIVMRCLEKDRTRRYQTASDVASDVLHHLRDEPVVARPPTAGYRLRKLVRRHRFGSVVMAIFAVFLVIGLVVLAQATRAEAAAKQRRAQIEQIFSGALAVADPGYSRGRNATLKDLLDATARWVPAATSDDPRLEADIRARMGETYCKLSLFESAAPHLEAAWAIRQRLLKEDNPDYLTSLRDLGVLRLWQQRYAEAEQHLGRVLAIQERMLGRDAEETLKTRNEIVFGWNLRLTLFGMSADTDRAKLIADEERFARESYELAKRRLGEEHPLTLIHEQNVARALGRDGLGAVTGGRPKLEESERMFGRNHQTCVRVLGPEHPITLGGMTEWGRSLLLLNRNDEALKCLEVGVPLCERVLGPEHGDTAWAMQQLEQALRRAGRSDEANRLIPRYLTAWLRVYGSGNAWIQGFIVRTLDRLTVTCGRPEAAAQFALDRLAEFRDRDHLPRDSALIGAMLLALADARLAQRNFTEAQQHLREATAILGRLTPVAEFLWTVHRELGSAYCAHLRFAEAEAEFQLADGGLRQLEPWGPRTRQEYHRLLTAFVTLYTEWNQPAKAAEWRQKLEAFGEPNAPTRTSVSTARRQ